MENKIYKKFSTRVDLEKIKEPVGSILGFFMKKSKKEIVDMVIYKSEAVFAISDNSIIIYDIIRECQVLDINEANKNDYNILQLQILYKIENIFPFDILVCLCTNNLLLINFDKFEIILNLELNSISQKCYIEFDKNYKILIVHKYSICVYELINFNNKIKLSKISEINSPEIISNTNILFCNNLIIFETKNKLNIFKLDYENLLVKNFILNKREISIFKNEDVIVNNNKNTEINKDASFNYSIITNTIYMTIYNKIFLIKNSYTSSDLFIEEFEILEKFSKQSQIQWMKIIDPYIFIMIDNKVYIHFIQDLNKCIEIIDSPSDSTLIFTKDLNFLLKINKLNFELNLINYDDMIHMNKLKFLSQSEFEFILNSCQYLLIFYNSKNFTLDYIYSQNLENQSRFLKLINANFSSKLLSHFSKENSKLAQSELKKINEKYFLKKHLESILSLISSQDYIKSKLCLEETEIDYIYLIILLNKFLHSQNLNRIVYYIFRNSIGNFNQNFNEHSIISESEKIINLNKDMEELNNLLENSMLKSEKELALFLKTFFNKFITLRNEIKIQLDKLDKEKRKKINFDKIIEIFEINNENDNEFNNINKNYYSISTKLQENQISEIELRYCLIENVIFLFHFYSFRFSKSSKYSDNLKLMIKISHNLLDKDLINMLKQFNLEEEILLFYYYRGNYIKCISNIVSIYESLSKVKEEDYNFGNFNNNYDDEFNFNKNENGNAIINENEESISNNNEKNYERSLDNIKNQWLNRYINLITIISEKLNQVEFYEYIKWALSKNPFKTIEILFETNKISKDKLDLDFINLLKSFGIDPVIFYLKKFLKNNESSNTLHHNEMINLYTIKVKLLQEALNKENKENINNVSFYKWNKKILKTREEFCNFLINQKLYNLEFAYDKIKTNPNLQIELGIVSVKQNKIEEGIYKIFFDEFPSKMKILKNLIKSMPIYEIVYLTIKYIFTYNEKSPEQLNRILFINEVLPVELIILDLLEVLKNEYELIIRIANLDLFNELKSDYFLKFFVPIFSNLDGNSKSLKIETSLVDAKFMNSYFDLIELQKGNIIVDNKSYCSLCNKGFFNSQFVFLYPKFLYHFDCYNEVIENNNI